jgi:hypothetical protein
MPAVGPESRFLGVVGMKSHSARLLPGSWTVVVENAFRRCTSQKMSRMERRMTRQEVRKMV